MEIEWRECAPGYFVSSDGRVRSAERMLRPWLLKTGYLQVELVGAERGVKWGQE